MSITNNFEKATRLKLRFETTKGNASVEELWDLPLTSSSNRPNLNSIAVGLYKKLESAENISFVDDTKASDEIIQLKFDIVRYIIEVKKNERKIASEIKANADKKQKLLAIIESKKDDALVNMDIAELEKMVKQLN